MKDIEHLQAKTKEEIIALFQEVLQNNQTNLDNLTEVNQTQTQKIESLRAQVNTLQHQLKQAVQSRYGKKSEKLSQDHPQQLLFDEAQAPEAIKVVEKENEEITIATYTRKKTGRKPLPKELPRKQVIHDLPEAEKICECGCTLTHIADDKSEQLEIIPAQVYVIENIKKKYACKACELTIKTAKQTAQIIPKSIATASLLAHVAVAKIDDHLPLYRQEEIFKRSGIDIPRASLSLWMIRIGEAIQPLINLMQDNINDYDIVYADETPVQVLNEKNRKATQKSYMWLFIGGSPEKRSYYYHYAQTRASGVPYQILDDFKGYLHCDGYSGYLSLFTTKPIKGVGCMAHARRKFVEITKVVKEKGLAHEAINIIAKLYAIEKQIKENQYSSNEIKAYRAEHAQPILDEFKQWLLTHKTKVPPSFPIGKAIAYTLKQWPYLINYIEDGRLEIDNNLSERGIKPFVIGRKNWMFMGNEHGARATTNLFSLIETAKAHQLNPFAYLRYVFEKLPLANTLEDYERLMPYNCQHLKQTA
ncbi:MAG: transposase [Legionellales bacterium]|nr:transposase [Legionellales bacterium]